MGNKFPLVFKKIGLNSLYIVDSSGLPLLIRNYFADEYSDEKNIIITSFASAITIFAQTILTSFISDIGIEDKRLFFKYQSGFIYLLVFDEDKLKGLTLNKLHELMAITVWRLDAIFKEFYHTELKSDEGKSLPIDIERKESKIDTLLAKGCKDWFDIQEKSISEAKDIKRKIFQKTSENKFLKDIGLNAFYLLDKKNRPLYTKLFVPKNPLIEDENIVSAFLTAIVSFSRIYLSSLEDVGMFDQRLFIRDSKYCTVVIIIDDLKFLAQSRFEEELVIDMFFKNIENELSKLLTRPRRKKRGIGRSSRKRRKPVQLTNTQIKNFLEFVNNILTTTFQQYKDHKT
ncbi:MAG: hypothetical protein HeimC3_07970 [Candidatus Heimdallarchaeota archaeon LC_3]|nr:MAG: hypothetical protein HeimC3_07970 [Candidatus Heimdallarchaeota archaeon LC_3]